MGASVTELGAALLAVGFAALPAMLLTGRVVDRVGSRVMPVALVLFGVLCGVAFVVESGIENWSALFPETELDASPAIGGLGPGVFAAAMVAGRRLGHWLEAVVGDLLLVGGAVTAGGGLVLAAVAPAVSVALLGFGLGGAGISVAAPTLFGTAGRGAPDVGRGAQWPPCPTSGS